ncbi:ABC transporter permease [Lacibacter luteus]|uniref:Transport permease protein n=1 Tax=Lacibacter luteus TaxID=2508719 RepID=A0A4Q1CDM3_9BACT|nr:ABC transporter permease [Lacibacter luteus]RXK57440.1 ABC transporter permease [Lacibacter luteus]
MSHLNDTNEHWDLEIKPQAGLFDLNLKEVWRYRDLLVLFVRRDFVAQYKQTVLGPVWHIIQPILTTLTFLLVFHSIAGIKTDGIEPILFYMSGITIWNYFSACLTATSNTFVANAGIFGKVYFPRLVLPLSVVMSNIVKLGIQFGLLVVVMTWFAATGKQPIQLGLHTLLIPVLVILIAGIGLGLGIIISSLTTKYRDFTVLISFAVQLLMYATPVAYPSSFLQANKYAWLIAWNPLSALVEGFRYALFKTGSFDVSSLLYSMLFMLVVLITGAFIFSKVERTFMDTV